ncbi:glycoside hydrolase family 16 protein [Roseibium sp.]|uniref:glycoside hydrolase family 16 protein n=1 Tax=Roseibium sp. TaxID=1936156 RepID=UPI003B50EB2A
MLFFTKLKNLTLSYILFSSIFSITSMFSVANASGEALKLDDFKLVFSEEFDRFLSISPWGKNGSRWMAHTPWNGDFGDAKFSNPKNGFPFTVHEGILRIEARKNSEGKWKSGLLAANPKTPDFQLRNGYFEARMKLPHGRGVWPAFWLIGVDRSNYTAEIDVVEHYGHWPDRFSSKYHIWRAKFGGVNTNNYIRTYVPEGSLSNEFHTYGVLLEPEQLIYYFDRKEIWKVPRPKEFSMNFYPLVNLALGSGWPIDETPNPSYLWIDYVKAYSPK